MSEGLLHKLERVSPPRVRITYDVERAGVIEQRELPFVIGVLADLGGTDVGAMGPFATRAFIELDREGLDEVMAALKPKLAFRVPDRLAGVDAELGIALEFSEMTDFDPLGVIRQVEPLRGLLEARQRLSDAEARRLRDEHDPVGRFDAETAAVDALISAQLNEILHHPDFQRLESSWRGLAAFVEQTETSSRLRIRLLPCTRGELQRDVATPAEPERSALFDKVCRDTEFAPFSLLLADLEFGRATVDLDLLRGLAGVSAAAHAPLVAAASPSLFGLSNFTDLGVPRDLSQAFEGAESAAWRSLRESEDSRFVALTLPRVLLRLPYGPKATPVEGVGFVEDLNLPDGNHARYLWGTASYALGARIASAFATFGWPAAFSGVEGGGLVDKLPAHRFIAADGDVALKCPTEVPITDRRERELSELGFICLVHCKRTDYAAFFGSQTLCKPMAHDTSAASADARMSVMLPYVLVTSRFAHFLRAIIDGKTGAFQTADQVRDALQTWLSGYVLLEDDAPGSTRAAFPLRAGHVEVADVPGRPGAYRVIAFLRPHFQLEVPGAAMRLVVAVPRQPPAISPSTRQMVASSSSVTQ